MNVTTAARGNLSLPMKVVAIDRFGQGAAGDFPRPLCADVFSGRDLAPQRRVLCVGHQALAGIANPQQGDWVQIPKRQHSEDNNFPVDTNHALK